MKMVKRQPGMRLWFLLKVLCPFQIYKEEIYRIALIL